MKNYLFSEYKNLACAYAQKNFDSKAFDILNSHLNYVGKCHTDENGRTNLSELLPDYTLAILKRHD